MADYKQGPLTTPVKLLIPTYAPVKGVLKKVFPEDGPLIWCNFKTYGGTERTINEVYSIEDTANVATWYRPDIASDCRIRLADTGAIYEIINEPENIHMRNQYLAFKVKRVKGGA